MRNLISDETFMAIQATHIIIVAIANIYYFSRDEPEKFIKFHWAMVAAMVAICAGLLVGHGVMILTKNEL